MLYNKNWDAKTVTSDPFTLESLIAWLEKQDANVRYDYTCNGHCLLGQYFTAMGFAGVDVTPSRVSHHGGCESLPKWFNAIALGGRCSTFAECNFQEGPSERTFGDALRRARMVAA